MTTSASLSRNPALFQINTRVALTALSRSLGRPASLDDFPDHELDRLAALGFDWVWFLGVWQTGPAGRRVSMSHHEWLEEYRALLGDFTENDICGSCFAIRDYSCHADFGGDAALERLRDRVHARGMRLLLDFVPNHTAPDHPWVQEHPDYYVAGTEEKLAAEPQNYTRTKAGILAYGRDPYFAGWPDTLQLNYSSPAVREAMAAQLLRVAAFCDGVRCDMAMLVLPDVFERTWGLPSAPFWPSAIERVRAAHPGFLFMAEVYWGLEWELQMQGFDYTYDKTLYDRLREGHARPVRDHFRAGMDYQSRSARFLENHDEPRAAEAFDWDRHQAAAVLSFLCPGLRFIHQGQMEGKFKRIPVHLGRGPDEPESPAVQEFYDRLLACLRDTAVRDGSWQLLDPAPAWDGNWTWDCFVCFAWRSEQRLRLVVVNYAPHRSQCRLPIPPGDLHGAAVTLIDRMGSERYERDASELASPGLYLDLPGWGYNVFDLHGSC